MLGTGPSMTAVRGKGFITRLNYLDGYLVSNVSKH